MDIIKVYAPGNTNITEKELSGMKDLTDSQIAELAKAYPNQPRGNAYLVLFDTSKKETEQLFPLNSWQNLHSLRKLGKKEWVPFGFKKTHVRPVLNSQPVSKRVVDLSDKDLKEVEGLKKTTVAVNIDPVGVKVEPVGDAPPELIAARQELQQAIDDKAHHMIIKKLQKAVDELEGGGGDNTGTGDTDTNNIDTKNL